MFRLFSVLSEKGIPGISTLKGVHKETPEGIIKCKTMMTEEESTILWGTGKRK